MGQFIKLEIIKQGLVSISIALINHKKCFEGKRLLVLKTTNRFTKDAAVTF